jgi:hypothetical protein
LLTAYRKYRALPSHQRKVLKAAGWLLPRIMLRIRIQGMQATRAWLKGRSLAGKVGGPLSPTSNTLEEAQVLARMVNIAAGHGLVRAHCLEKSLLVEAFCRARGIDCELKFGVHNDGRPFTAHAWVEVQGQALADRGSGDPALSPLA